jgi:hypothetical protein
MTTSYSDNFYTNRAWFRDYVSNEEQPVVLCHTSALECLELFPGYGNEKEIDVFAQTPGKYENVHYHIIDDLSKLETEQFGTLTCTSLNQTINDMLDEYDTMDEQALIEGLAMHYCRQGRSFEGLVVKPEHRERFEIIKQWASEHFGGGY